MGGTPRPGTISWTDLTVEDADGICDFYQAVTGWAPEPLSSDDDSDYVMNDADGEAVAGICHARGNDGDPPAHWLIYITVDDLDHSMAECRRLGGTVLTPPRSYGGGRYCIIKDPVGAICALYQPPDAA